MANNILSGTVVLRGVLDGAAYGASITAKTLSGSGDTTLLGPVTLGGGLHVSGAIGAEIKNGPLYVGSGIAAGVSTGVLSGSAAATLYGLTTYDVSATALSSTSLSASSTLNIGGVAQFANSKATINNTGDYLGGALSASSTLHVVGVSTFGAADYASISTAGVVSGSAAATLYGLTTHGIVGTTIEGSSLSSSNTLVAVGNSQFGAETGPGAYATISSAGAIAGTSLSSSGDTAVGGGLYVSGAAGARISSGPLYIGTDKIKLKPTGEISGSVTATLYALTTHGIVGTSIEGSSLSSSNTLVAAGNSQFGAETGAAAYASISSAGAIASTSLSSSGDVTLAGGLSVSGNLANHGVHIYRGLRVGPTSGGDTISGVISGSSAATLYGLTTYEVDAVTLRGAGQLLQGITGSGAATIPISHALDGGSLARGVNYFTASNNPVTVRVPSGAYGDQVVVKASTGVTYTNYIKITGTIAIWGETGAIDGQTDVKITSPNGSVTLVYVKDSDWRIL